jgi:hypothetical protein
LFKEKKMPENGFDPNSILRKPIFTIPVLLTDRDDEGGEVERKILLQYQFDDELEEEIGGGIFDAKLTEQAQQNAKQLAGEGNEIPEVKPVMREFTLAEQLAKIVKGIRGISVPLDVAYWKGVPQKHRNSIIAAINADVNPPRKPSTA